jgi:hypothetical protein
VEVGLLESTDGGAAGILLSPRSRPLPSPSSFRNLAVAAAAGGGSTQHHPHKGRLLKTEVHSELQALAIHTSGGLLRWVRSMHRLAIHTASTPTTLPGGPTKKEKAATKSAGASPMVAHEATLRLGTFAFVADRLEDWEEEKEEEEAAAATLGLSGSGANAGRVVHPHAHYEIQVRDVFVSSTAAPSVGGRRPNQQHQQRPFFRQRTGSGNCSGGGGGGGGAGGASNFAIPSSSDEDDAGGADGRSSLLHKCVVDAVDRLMDEWKEDPHFSGGHRRPTLSIYPTG